MQIHRIHGRDLREALERAGRLHGTDAVLLGHEHVASGVTIAVAGKPPPAPPDGEPAGRPARRKTRAEPRRPGLFDVERALVRSGSSPGLIAAVLEALEAEPERGPYALDRAAEILGARVPVAPSPRTTRGRPCALALLGARGSGVTTTLIKLAGQLVRQRRRVALVALRGGAPSATSLRELEKYAPVLQVPCDAVQGARELCGVLERSKSFDAVLLDGTGIAGRDVALLREARALDPELRLEVYLTLPATAYRGELEAIAADYAAAGPSALVLTQLDRTRAPAPALELAADGRRPLALLCDGPDVARNLHRPTPDKLADLFLRGRLA